jgi:hypothetical protein
MIISRDPWSDSRTRAGGIDGNSNFYDTISSPLRPGPVGTFRCFIPAGIKNILWGARMSVFRFDRNSAPTQDQSERYMIGKIDEECFGPGGEIVLIEYPEAYYLRDNREGIRILYTGPKDKQKAIKEVRRRMQRYDQERHPQAGVH